MSDASNPSQSGLPVGPQALPEALGGAPAAPPTQAPAQGQTGAPAVPPAPPALELPEIPATAHAACAGKKDGTRLTLTPRPGETMGGVCEQDGGKMVFQLRSYHRAD